MENFFQNKKVLITGGLGFLGSNLAHALCSQGAQVALLDCLLPVHGGNPFNISDIDGKARWIEGDLRDAALLEKLAKDHELIFNIAAQTSHTDSMQQPFLDSDINSRGQLNLLEACRKHSPNVRIVYCSTRAIYGSPDKRVADEKATPKPMDIYSVHKLAGEHYHQIYSRVHGLKTTILRVANGYGPRAQMKQPSFGILNWFIRLALDSQDIKIFGDGKQVRDYVYVEDIVQAFMKAAQSAKMQGEIYNVGSGKGVPLINIVKEVVKIAKSGKIVHVPWPETNKKIDVGDFIANVAKIKKELKWKPSVSLKDGLGRTIEFYRKNKKHYW